MPAIASAERVGVVAFAGGEIVPFCTTLASAISGLVLGSAAGGGVALGNMREALSSSSKLPDGKAAAL